MMIVKLKNLWSVVFDDFEIEDSLIFNLAKHS